MKDINLEHEKIQKKIIDLMKAIAKNREAIAKLVKLRDGLHKQDTI
jgi:hypothetical protein|tara:strand:+ start:1232 stop:1369 length:138 start_codon:yes stop_codon:yes gene_type:complete